MYVLETSKIVPCKGSTSTVYKEIFTTMLFCSQLKLFYFKTGQAFINLKKFENIPKYFTTTQYTVSN